MPGVRGSNGAVCVMMMVVACVIMLLMDVVIIGAVSPVPLAFRLDDIQCGWMEANQQSIIDAFIRHAVPLTIGVITGPGDCYSTWLRPRLANTTNSQLEVASHSVTHPHMANLTYAAQLAEVSSSRLKLLALLPERPNITHFIAPYNNWNFDTIRALVAAGYTSMAGQCTADEHIGNGIADHTCTPNMYPNISRPFFKSIDGIRHIDAGASTSDFVTALLLNVSTFVNGTTALCIATQGTCSILSQVNGMAAFTDESIGAWSSIMMHPQDFSDGDSTTINNYFDTLLPILKRTYQFFTLSNLPFAASLQTTSSSSTGSAPSLTPSSTCITVPNTVLISFISFMTLLRLVFFV